MAHTSCFGLSRGLARRAAIKRATEPRDKKPMLPSNQALLRSAPGQPTLRVSEPSDPAEREADAMAERIVARQGEPELQRACSECEAEQDEQDQAHGLGPIARQAEEAGAEEEEFEDDEGIETMNDDSMLMMKSAGRDPGGTQVPASTVPREAGAALAPGVRRAMESGFGASLGHVRVHTGTAAAESATLLRARAYTVGNHVYFGAGQYAPESQSGSRLLAHELTHVLQQSRAGAARTLLREKPKGSKDKGKADKPKDPPAPKITRIDIDLSGQEMTLTFEDGSTEQRTVSTGKGKKGTEGDPCATQKETNCTPTGTFKIGYKRGASHKNSKGDAMAWFVELTGDKVIDGRGIGIHNSQYADGVPRSHGCIRVGKGEAAVEFARKVNKGVTSDTTVVITGKAATKAYGKTPKKKSAPKKAPPKKVK